MGSGRRGIAAALVLVASLSAPVAGQSAPIAAPGYYVQSFAPDVQRFFTAAQLSILEKLNRRDLEHLARLPSVIAPDVWSDDELIYSRLPRVWSWAEPLPKALVVDQPSQVFGAYEWGHLVRWGQYSLTWKARTRRSTDNAEWILNWYFNFINARGISFHEFELPGRPASHACVRLLTRDAEWVYRWGEQWRISEDQRTVVTPGTPVIILGVYDFSKPPPWVELGWWARGVALP